MRSLIFRLFAKAPIHCCSICIGSRHHNCTPSYTGDKRVHHKLVPGVLHDADIMTSRMGVLLDTVMLTPRHHAVVVPSALIPLSMHCLTAAPTKSHASAGCNSLVALPHYRYTGSSAPTLASTAHVTFRATLPMSHMCVKQLLRVNVDYIPI